MDAMSKEMRNLKVAFDVLKNGSKILIGYKKASGYLVFDARMTLESKALWVNDEHRTPEPEWSNFSGILSREYVRVALTYAAMNDLPICTCDVHNDYLKAPSSKKHHAFCGPEFGLENVGQFAIIVRALCGGNLLKMIIEGMFAVLWNAWDYLHSKLTLMCGLDLS